MLNKSIAVAAVLISLPTMNANSDDGLWLPSSQIGYYPQLKKAAEAAQTLPDCIFIQEGTLDLEQSRKDHPIFRIKCRRSSGKTYNEMVDGISFEPLTTKLPTAEEIQETIRIQRTLFEHFLTGACVYLFQKELLGMAGVTFTSLNKMMTEANLFYFDAEIMAYDINQNAIYFYGSCEEKEYIFDPTLTNYDVLWHEHLNIDISPK